MMQWTAPAPGIAMCQDSMSIDELLMSPFGYKQTFSRPKLRSALPPTADIDLGQIQAPACRRRNGLTGTIKVAGFGFVHVALVNERPARLAGDFPEPVNLVLRRLPILG